MIAWTEAMKVRLMILVYEGYFSYAQIAEKMSDEFKRNIGRKSCIGMAYRLMKPDRRTIKTPPPKPKEVRPVDIMGLTSKTCRWPLGGIHQLPPYQYCAHAPVEGSPYCVQHYKKSYTR